MSSRKTKMYLLLFPVLFHNGVLFGQDKSVVTLESKIKVLLSEDFAQGKKLGNRLVKPREKLEYTGVLQKHANDSFSLSIPQNSQLVTIPFAGLEKVELYRGKQRRYVLGGELELVLW